MKDLVALKYGQKIFKLWHLKFPKEIENQKIAKYT